MLLRDATAETGARNERRVCAAYCNRSAGLENVHGLLDKICEVSKKKKRGEKEGGKKYSICFFFFFFFCRLSGSLNLLTR